MRVLNNKFEVVKNRQPALLNRGSQVALGNQGVRLHYYEKMIKV